MINTLKNKFKDNGFITVGIFSAIAAASKILTTLCIGKIIAILLGPEGFGLIGQITNFTLIATVFAGNSITQGVTKYVAEYKSTSPEELPRFISAAFTFYLMSWFIVALVIIVGSAYISKNVLYTEQYTSVFILLAFSLLFIVLNNFLLSVVNGYKEFKLFNLLNIGSNITGLVLSALLIYSYNLYGVLVSVFLSQGVGFFLSLFVLRKKDWFTKYSFKLKLPADFFKKLMPFATFGILSTALYPVVSMFARVMVSKMLSLEASGIYEFIMRISGSSLLVFSLVISTYYIPRVSEIKSYTELQKEMRTIYKIALPAILVLLITIYFLRDFIIVVLASNKFSDASGLFLLQLTGDFFKVCTQVISFILLARAWIKAAIILEIVYYIIYLSFLYLFIHFYGFKGISMAYAAAFVVHFIIFIFYYKWVIVRKMKNLPNGNLM